MTVKVKTNPMDKLMQEHGAEVLAPEQGAKVPPSAPEPAVQAPAPEPAPVSVFVSQYQDVVISLPEGDPIEFKHGSYRTSDPAVIAALRLQQRRVPHIFRETSQAFDLAKFKQSYTDASAYKTTHSGVATSDNGKTEGLAANDLELQHIRNELYIGAPPPPASAFDVQ